MLVTEDTEKIVETNTPIDDSKTHVGDSGEPSVDKNNKERPKKTKKVKSDEISEDVEPAVQEEIEEDVPPLKEEECCGKCFDCLVNKANKKRNF